MAKKVISAETAPATVVSAETAPVGVDVHTAPVGAEPEVESEPEAPAAVNFFDQFQSEDEVKTREDIVAELMLKPTVKKLSGLHIRNVVCNTTKDVPFLTFVVKEFVIGDTRGTATDAFGVPEVVLGRTHNVVVSAYAVAAVMKDNPRTALFAQRVAAGADVANVLFAGGTMDVLMEYVAAGESYINPFATNSAERVFDRDHVIIHVLSLEMGETGRDAYAAMLARI